MVLLVIQLERDSRPATPLTSILTEAFSWLFCDLTESLCYCNSGLFSACVLVSFIRSSSDELLM